MRRYAFPKVILMVSYMEFSARTMTGSCSAIADFAIGALLAFLGAVGFTSGELGLFVGGFREAVVFVAVATVDRVEAFALIEALIAGGGLGDGSGGTLVRVDARVGWVDAFARPAMMATISVVSTRIRQHAFATRCAT